MSIGLPHRGLETGLGRGMGAGLVVNSTELLAMAKIPLKANCLNFSEVLAQAVALISPTMTAALIIPVMY